MHLHAHSALGEFGTADAYTEACMLPRTTRCSQPSRALSPKSTNGTASSSGDFSAALGKLFNPHLQNNSKSDTGSGNASKHSRSQDGDASAGSSAHNSSHTDTKSNQDAAQPQQAPVTMSMLGKPTAVVFSPQQPADASINLSTASTPATASTGLTTQVGLSGPSNSLTSPTDRPVTALNSLQSGDVPSAPGSASVAQPATSDSDAQNGAIIATGDDASSAPTSSVIAPSSPLTTGTAPLNSTANQDAAAPVPTDGTATPIPSSAVASDTLFGPTQDDSDASSTAIPVVPTAFAPGDTSTTAVLASPGADTDPDIDTGMQVQPAPSPTFTPVSDVTAAGTPAPVPTFTPVSHVTAAGALAASPSFTGISPVTAAGALDITAQPSQPVQPGPVHLTPIAAVTAVGATGGHNQIAVAHRPIQNIPATNPTSTAPVATSPAPTTQPTSGSDLHLNINNGFIHAPTGPTRTDNPVTASNGNQNGTGDSATTASPVAASGASSLYNSTGSSDNTGSSSSSDSSDSKDRSKDDTVSAVATATAQSPLVAPISVTTPVQATPAGTNLPVNVGAEPSTSNLPGSVNAKASDLETASISDTKSIINTSKLMQTVNQSEMRVGMRSAEFGDISIRAQATHDSILTQIQVDHPELASSLATHVPDMQARLASHGNVEIQVNSTQAHSGSSTPTDSGSSYQGNGSQAGSQQGSQQDQGSSRSYFSNSYGNTSYGNSALPAAAVANSLQNAGYDGRLDLQA